MQQDFRPLIHAVTPSCCPLQLGQIYVDLYHFLPVHISPPFPYVNLTALSETQYIYIYIYIYHGSPTFFMEKGHTRYCGLVRGPHVQK